MDKSLVEGKLIEVDMFKGRINVLTRPDGERRTFNYEMKYEDIARFVDENVILTKYNEIIIRARKKDH